MFTKVFLLIKYTKLLWFPSASCFLTVQQWQLFGRLQLLPSTSILMSSNLWWSNFISTIIMLTFLWSSFFLPNLLLWWYLLWVLDILDYCKYGFVITARTVNFFSFHTLKRKKYNLQQNVIFFLTGFATITRYFHFNSDLVLEYTHNFFNYNLVLKKNFSRFLSDTS